MKKFSNRTALITGGNSGIGYATAQRMIGEGATVIITGRRKDAIEKAAAELGAIPYVADQSSLSDINALAAEVQDRFESLDILFINAGIVGKGGPIAQMNEPEFDEVMGINFKGAYFTLSKFIPVLKDGASVVVLSSMVSSTYKANSSLYQASKAALHSFAKTAANELAPRKIRVNLVSPGPIHTEIMYKTGLENNQVEGIFDYLRDIIPLKRMGKPQEVAAMVAYLCEDQAQFITGADFVIDGGITL